MSLLPYRYSQLEQDFASLMMDENARCTYDELDTNPMTCKASVLPHLALSKNLNIEGMLEREARLFVANARDMYNIKGTVEGALNALESVGLHSLEYPAEIIEYRDMYTRVYAQKHDGMSFQNGVSKHNGTLPYDVFELTKWYEIAVIISMPSSIRQLGIGYRILKEVIPARCKIVGFITKNKDLHDGVTLQDGSRNHGIWRFE